MSRLNRDNVERQIYEMWDAVSTCGDETGQAQADARRIEKDLRDRLERQERMEAAAPELLEALQFLRESAWKRRTGNVKKDFDLLNACACADKAIRKATGAT